MREIKLKLPYWELAGLHFDGNGPNILALHGWLDNAASFASIAPLLNANVVALDWTGHGLSGRRPAGTLLHVHDLVFEIIAAMEQLGWEKCTLLGHSLGAAVSTLAAGAFPDKFEKLLLIDGLGPMVRLEQDNPKMMHQAISKLLQLSQSEPSVYPSVAEALLKRARASKIEPEQIRAVVERGLEQVDGGYIWRTDPRLMIPSSMQLTDSQVLAFIRNITAPVTLIRPKSGFDYSPADMHTRVKCLQDVSLIEIEGHHHVHLQYPGLVAQKLNAALAQ